MRENFTKQKYSQIKNYGYSASMLLLLLVDFVIIEIYPQIQERIGLVGWITFFGSACLCNALFGVYFVPETRGKSHEEIMQLLD